MSRRSNRLSSILVVAVLASGSARAAPPAPPSAAASNVAGGMSAGGPSAEDRLGEALRQIGMTQCAASVERAAHFLFEDGEANFTVQPLGPDANRWPTVIVIEGAHAAAGRTRFSTLTVAPGPGCSGLYEQVIAWPTPCAELKATTFSAYGAAKVILRNVQVSELNPGLQVYLMPAGAGCVSIKKELFH
jgi:hypothetical protein